MKRFSAILICFLSLFTVISCSKGISNAVLVCGFSDSVPEIRLSNEYTAWSEGIYTDTMRAKKIEGHLGDLTFSGEYQNSRPVFGTCETMHLYSGDHYQFCVDDTDQLVYYYADEDDNPAGNALTKDECRKIVNDFLTETLKLGLDCHTEQVSFDKDKSRYTFSYTKMIRGFASEDNVVVEVSTNGHILYFKSTLFNKIDEDDVPGFDISVIESKINDKLHSITEDAQKAYQAVEFNVVSRSISKIGDSAYAFIYTVEILCKNYGEYGDTVRGERVFLLVKLG